MRVLAFCLIAPLAASAAAQTPRPAARAVPRSSAKSATAPVSAKPSSAAAAHFTATGLNNEDDLVRIYTGDFQSIKLDRGGTEFMMIISDYMEDFGRDCKKYLPPNKVEITVQVCNDAPPRRYITPTATAMYMAIPSRGPAAPDITPKAPAFTPTPTSTTQSTISPQKPR